MGKLLEFWNWSKEKMKKQIEYAIMHINEKVHTPTYFFSKSRRLRFWASPPIPWCNMNLELLWSFFLLLQNFITSIIDISASNLGWSVGLVLGSVILNDCWLVTGHFRLEVWTSPENLSSIENLMLFIDIWIRCNFFKFVSTPWMHIWKKKICLYPWFQCYT